MAREDLVARRYDGLSVGPRLVYSFETQDTIPIDGTNSFLREFSPFTLSFVPPSIIADGSNSFNVNILARADRSTKEFQTRANEFRESFGTGSISGTSQNRLNRLQQIVSAGQIISGVSSDRERAVLVDQFTAADIALQVEQMLQFPPLTLLINPNSFSVDYNQVQEYGSRTRKGFVFERWGEEQPSISFGGSSAGFVTAKFPNSVNKAFSGMGWPAKRNSAGFQNFMALYTFYRNNGLIHDQINETEAHHMVGAIAINYDQMTYIGHMESFDYSYNPEMPNRLEYSISFKADVIFDNSGDPSYLGPPKSVGNNNFPDTFQGNGGAIDPFSDGAGDAILEGFENQIAQTPLGLFLPEGR